MKEPTFEGPRGKAWKVSSPAGHPSCGSYYVHRPGELHWTWWQLSVVHLRPVESHPPANLTLAGATHEFVFAALDTFGGTTDPETATPDPDAPSASYLKPLDFIGQFAGLTDEIAGRVLDLVVRAVVAGVVPVPDSDRRAWWGMLMQNTVVHELTGGHHATGGAA